MLLYVTCVTRCTCSHWKLQAFHSICEQIRDVFRVVWGEEMENFASRGRFTRCNVGLVMSHASIPTAESFCLRRAYNLYAIVVHNRARKIKRPTLEAYEQRPSLTRGKNYWQKPGPSVFSWEFKRLFTGLRCAAKKALQSQEQPYCFDWFGFQWDANQNRVWNSGVRECFGTHRVILLSYVFFYFRAGLWATAGLLPLIGVSFAFAILLVNQDLEMFHYVFAAFCFSQVKVSVFNNKL